MDFPKVFSALRYLTPSYLIIIIASFVDFKKDFDTTRAFLKPWPLTMDFSKAFDALRCLTPSLFNHHYCLVCRLEERLWPNVCFTCSFKLGQTEHYNKFAKIICHFHFKNCKLNVTQPQFWSTSSRYNLSTGRSEYLSRAGLVWREIIMAGVYHKLMCQEHFSISAQRRWINKCRNDEY